MGLSKGLMAIGAIVVFLIIWAIYAMTRPVEEELLATPTPTPTASPEVNASVSISPSPTAEVVTVTYNGTAFSPATVTLTSGQTLTIRNSSSTAVEPNSDPHPQHTSNTELNFGRIDAGASKSMTVTRTGTFGMHNHLAPSQKLAVTIN